MADDEWQTRTWDELKAETQARAASGTYPVFGISAADAREALAMIGSLDPEEWGAAWMTIGDRYAERAQAALRTGNGQAAQDGHLAAWRLYTFGRWPVASSPKKAQCLEKARQAFAAYGQLVDPKIETVRIPFEGKEVVVLLQRPPGVARPPIVISIGG